MIELKNKNKRAGRKQRFFLALYLLCVFWITLLNRETRFRSPELELFWSYRCWFAGDWRLGWEIIANVAMFIPFGFLMKGIVSKRKDGSTGAAFQTDAVILVSAALFSLLIETLQFVLMRGLFEWDDVFNNTLGALIGVGLAAVMKCV